MHTQTVNACIIQSLAETNARKHTHIISYKQVLTHTHTHTQTHKGTHTHTHTHIRARAFAKS